MNKGGDRSIECKVVNGGHLPIIIVGISRIRAVTVSSFHQIAVGVIVVVDNKAAIFIGQHIILSIDGVGVVQCMPQFISITYYLSFIVMGVL